MADLEKCPRCDRKVSLLPQAGGTPSGGFLVHEVKCKCGLHEKEFGWKNGKTATARAEWNRWSRAERERLRRVDRTGPSK